MSTIKNITHCMLAAALAEGSLITMVQAEENKTNEAEKDVNEVIVIGVKNPYRSLESLKKDAFTIANIPFAHCSVQSEQDPLLFPTVNLMNSINSKNNFTPPFKWPPTRLDSTGLVYTST